MTTPNLDRSSQPLFGERDDPRTDEEREDDELEMADQQHDHRIDE